MVENVYNSLEGTKYAIPSELIPRHPEDGTELTPWIRLPGFLGKDQISNIWNSIE